MQFERIENLRIDNDLTQQEVADYLHCQREVYRRYEKGTRQIPVDYVIALAKLYNVTTDYLLNLSNKK
ncbi:MAG: helix-turn-helix transcriptional regulator [Lachnospiraceae bacterium]|nr:helix-turn-helix transcriptional regulator [Lachnospiraceae bacterium]